jgi:hypothetical protein
MAIYRKLRFARDKNASGAAKYGGGRPIVTNAAGAAAALFLESSARSSNAHLARKLPTLCTQGAIAALRFMLAYRRCVQRPPYELTWINNTA